MPRRNNKKKNSKQATPTSITPANNSTSNLINDKDVVDSTLGTTTPQLFQPQNDSLEQAKTDIPAEAPVAITPEKTAVTPSNDTNTSFDSNKLPDFIQTSIDNAVGARAIDIDSIISSIKQKVSDGEYKEKPKETLLPVSSSGVTEGKSSTTPDVAAAVAGTGATQVENHTNKDTDLSKAVEYGIQSVVQSTAVDAYEISHASHQNETKKSTEKKPTEQSSSPEQEVPQLNDQKPGESQQLKAIPTEEARSQKTPETKPQTSSADSTQGKPPATPPKPGDNTQKKVKSSEHKKSFFKKKDCIIL